MLKSLKTLILLSMVWAFEAQAIGLFNTKLFCVDLFQDRTQALINEIDRRNQTQSLTQTRSILGGKEHVRAPVEIAAGKIARVEVFQEFMRELEIAEVGDDPSFQRLIGALNEAAFEGDWGRRSVHVGLIEKRMMEVLRSLPALMSPDRYGLNSRADRYWSERARHSLLVNGARAYAEQLGLKIVEHGQVNSVYAIRTTIWHDVMKPIARMLLVSNPLPYRTLSENQIIEILVSGYRGVPKYIQAQFFRLWNGWTNLAPKFAGYALATSVALGTVFGGGMAYRTAIDIEADKVYDAVVQAFELKSLQNALQGRIALSVYHRAVENYKNENGEDPPAKWVEELRLKMKTIYPEVEFPVSP